MMQNNEEETQENQSVIAFQSMIERINTCVSATQETGEVADTGLIIDPKAEPTYVQMEILFNLNPRFRSTWEMKRSDLEDPSPRSYDMELANFGVAADLSDQVIVDLLIAFRSRNNLTKEPRMDYYLSTLKKAKAEFARTQVITWQLEKMADTESEDEVDKVKRRAEAMESLQVIFPGFVIKSITISSNSTKTSFVIETNRGNIRLNGIEDLLQQPRFTKRVAQEIHRVLDLKFKKRDWQAIAQLILDASVPKVIADPWG